MKMIAAAPVSSAPNSQRGTSMKLAPRNAAALPVAVATEFIVTTWSRGTTSRQRGRQTRGDEAGEAVDDQRAEQDRQVARRRPPAVRRRRAPAPAARGWRRPTPAAGPSGPAARRRTGPAPSRAGTTPRTQPAIAHGPAARSGLNSRAARQARLEQAVAELAHRPQFEQSPEFGQARAPNATSGDRRACVSHGNHVLLGSANRATRSQYKYPGGPRLFATLIVRW